MVEPGGCEFTDEEVRRAPPVPDDGGFMMVDDSGARGV
jgi:hypothetical protein